MEIKYKTIHGKIKKVQIERESEHSVWFKNPRNGKVEIERKSTNWYLYFDSFDEAKQSMIDKQLRIIRATKSSLEMHETELEKIKGIKDEF